MAYTHFERLSALDDSFLEIEDGNSHMHIGAVAVFEGGSLAMPEGGVDIERVRTLMEAGLHRFPRYRQRLESTPAFGQPVWVDDRRFNLAYHVRHTHLPRPGDERQLKRLVGRLMSQELDRGKPLWEMWVVEGLGQGRFAIVTKAHPCMIDGVGSVELTGSVMRATAPMAAASGALTVGAPGRRARPPRARALGRRDRGGARLDRAAGSAVRCPGHHDRCRPGAGRRLLARIADAVQRRDRATPPLRLDGRRPGEPEGHAHPLRGDGE